MEAPGAPGADPTWGPGRKQAFATAPGLGSRVWLTIAGGNLSEVFFPSLHRPALHSMRFLVAARGSPPIDDAAEAEHSVAWQAPGVPIFSIKSKHAEYELSHELVLDPDLDGILISGTYKPDLPDLRLYLLASPHLDSSARGNYAAALEMEPPVLVAQQDEVWMAIVGPFSRATAGYLNRSDLFVDLHDNDGLMTARYDHAGPGNVALGAEFGIPAGLFQLAIGFAHSLNEAEAVARQVLAKGARTLRRAVEAGCRKERDLANHLPKAASDGGRLARCSLSVLRSLEDKTQRGAFVAAPCAPWGTSRGDGGHVYHRVWPRDQYHIATALIDAGDPQAGLRALHYLHEMQRRDGSWPVSFTLEGKEYWPGMELDEVALPVLLAWRLGVVECLDFDPYPSLVRRAVAYLLANGPATPMDRWEDAGGLSPSTLAASISALLVAAEFADDAKEKAAAAHLRTVADYWADRIEAWCYSATQRCYLRLGKDPDAGPDPDGPIGVEFLELVRFGVRPPDHPAVLSSLERVDQLLKVDTPSGPAWRRYWGDAYGERDDGSPWDGSGHGRPWPLLTGERARHTLVRGESAAELVAAMERFSGPAMMLPEQVWDAPAVPARDLRPGEPTGSASPLGWAHAEYLKVLAAIARGASGDLIDPVHRRYGAGAPRRPAFVWSHAHQITTFAQGRRIRIQLPRWGRVWWSAGGAASRSLVEATDSSLGLWAAELPTQDLRAGSVVEWTVHYGDAWEGRGYRLTCV